jgi:hypothetical protein
MMIPDGIASNQPAVATTPQEALVVFFDVVGFSHHLSKRNAEAVFADLVAIWDAIRHEFSAMPRASVYLFSDCGFLLYPLSPAERRDLFLRALADVRFVLDRYLDCGFLLRGALAIGSVSHGNNLLVGQPVVAAVRCEEEYNPGPFILVPSSEREKAIPGETFIQEVKEAAIRLKGDEGTMLASIVYPSDWLRYVDLIVENAHRFLRYGPYDLASYYAGALSFLRSHQPDWFDNRSQ